jgi:hypothetical protein
MKKLILAFAAAATLSLGALAPTLASAKSLAVEISPKGIELVQHRHHDRYDRWEDRRHRGWHRDRGPRKICTVHRERRWTPVGWRVEKVRDCRVIRGR